MRKYVKMLVVPALVLAAACGRDEKPMDEALKNDLAWRRRCRHTNRSSSCRRWSRAMTATGTARSRSSLTATTRARRSLLRSAGSIARRRRSSSGTYSTGTASTGTRVVKNTKRDAIIGGVAGAAIGAVTTSRQAQGRGDRRCRRQRARRGDRQQRGHEEDSVLSTLVRSTHVHVVNAASRRSGAAFYVMKVSVIGLGTLLANSLTA